MNRRTVLAAAGSLLGAGGLAGCLEGQSGGATPSPDSTPTDPTASPTDGPTEGPTPTGGPTTGSPASSQPDPDLPIIAENHDDATHAIALAVEQGSEMPHEATYDLDPGADRELYNLRETDPDGIESFTVRATLGDQEETVGVRTNACHGHVVLWITEAGDLEMTYAIC